MRGLCCAENRGVPFPGGGRGGGNWDERSVLLHKTRMDGWMLRFLYSHKIITRDTPHAT